MNTNATITRFSDTHVQHEGKALSWEAFWLRLEREYHHVKQELDPPPDLDWINATTSADED